jgi:TolB protein
LSTGCPQLLDDDFLLLSTTNEAVPDASAGEATSRAGSSGAGGAPSSESPGGSGGTAGSVSATCDDGWLNGDETGTDCGASCGPCGCVGEFPTPEFVSTGLGATGIYYGPALSRDNQTLYFSNTVDGDENIYRARRSDRGRSFANAVSLIGINTVSGDGSPYVTPDGLSLYFYSDREGGPGNRDLWTATRTTTSADFAAPEVLAVVNGSAREYFPWLTPDGLGLLFMSDRAGGQGRSDIWLAERRSATDAFSVPRNLSELNTSAHEGGMTLSRDGLTIIFVSDRAGGSGDTDLWMAQRARTSDVFSAPSNLGAVNSNADDEDPKLSSDGRELLFSSTRDGLRHIWRTLRSCD